MSLLDSVSANRLNYTINMQILYLSMVEDLTQKLNVILLIH